MQNDRDRLWTLFESFFIQARQRHVLNGTRKPDEDLYAFIIGQLEYAPPIDGESAQHYAARLLADHMIWTDYRVNPPNPNAPPA